MELPFCVRAVLSASDAFSSGHHLDHLAADEASLTGDQVIVLSILVVHANLANSLYYEQSMALLTSGTLIEL